MLRLASARIVAPVGRSLPKTTSPRLLSTTSALLSKSSNPAYVPKDSSTPSPSNPIVSTPGSPPGTDPGLGTAQAFELDAAGAGVTPDATDSALEGARVEAYEEADVAEDAAQAAASARPGAVNDLTGTAVSAAETAAVTRGASSGDGKGTPIPKLPHVDGRGFHTLAYGRGRIHPASVMRQRPAYQSLFAAAHRRAVHASAYVRKDKDTKEGEAPFDPDKVQFKPEDPPLWEASAEADVTPYTTGEALEGAEVEAYEAADAAETSNPSADPVSSSSSSNKNAGKRGLHTSAINSIRIKKPEGATPAEPTKSNSPDLGDPLWKGPKTPTPAEEAALKAGEGAAGEPNWKQPATPLPNEPEQGFPASDTAKATKATPEDFKFDADAVQFNAKSAPLTDADVGGSTPDATLDSLSNAESTPKNSSFESAAAAQHDAADAAAVADTPDLSKLPSLDIDPEAQVNAAIQEPKKKEEGKGAGEGAAGAGGERRGRKGKEYVSSIERQRRLMSRLGLGALLVGGIGAAYYLGEADGEAKASQSMWERFKSNFTELSDYFSKPAFKQLLPDPLPLPHGRPYTLLVDLEDLLVHSEWDRQHGWRTAKRPGVDYFLGYLSQFYEIVLFTSQPNYTAISVAEKLDPFTLYLPYRLYRESTRYVDNKVVKDLSYLNRDLSKVVMLDTNADHAMLQPDNAVIIKPWDGKKGDRGLVEMIPFLESIGIFAPPDVRPVLKNYAGKDIPREFAKAEAAMNAQAQADWERTHPASSSGGGFFSGMLGSGATTRPQKPMTLLEIRREQAQKAYAEEQKYFKEHGEEITRMIEEDKQRQMEEMKSGMLSWFGAPTQSPEEKAAAAALQNPDGVAAKA